MILTDLHIDMYHRRRPPSSGLPGAPGCDTLRVDSNRAGFQARPCTRSNDESHRSTERARSPGAVDARRRHRLRTDVVPGGADAGRHGRGRRAAARGRAAAVQSAGGRAVRLDRHLQRRPDPDDGRVGPHVDRPAGTPHRPVPLQPDGERVRGRPGREPCVVEREPHPHPEAARRAALVGRRAVHDRRHAVQVGAGHPQRGALDARHRRVLHAGRSSPRSGRRWTTRR